ncbi:MAG: MFS transporter [Cytophagales bacterium]|nr:MFS transporter [Cytophagales bacterium]
MNQPLSKPMLWSLLFGNLAVGMGIMVVPATLTNISDNLGTSVSLTGQLITAGSILMGVSAPLFAALVSRWDRRRLLTFTMAWYALFHLLCAIAPSFTVLMIARVLAVITPAIFTPQAAACVGLLAKPEERGRAITFIFLGWSISSVFCVPLLATIGGELGWRWAFGLVSIVASISALWVWRVLPSGIQIAALSKAAWLGVFKHRILMMTVSVTLLAAFGQFVLFSYFTAYYKQVVGANTSTISLYFLWFGFCGLVGNLVLSRYIERIGADRAPIIAMSLMALSLLIWPLGTSVASVLLVCTPWGLGCFASNSAQQARLASAAPLVAGASIALNTSAMYSGQAFGAGLGGWLIAHDYIQSLHWYGFAVMLCAIAVSSWSRRTNKTEK